MAQGLVGVGGVPRNIAEIKVGAGGVRTVTEAYVGVNGAPRLCWSGNKWANKLYKTDNQQLYKIDTNTLTETLLTTLPIGTMWKAGGGFNQFYHSEAEEGSRVIRDMNTFAAVRDIGQLPGFAHSNVERRGAYVYYRNYTSTGGYILDATTYAYAGAGWLSITVSAGSGTNYLAANSASLYADGYVSGYFSVVRLDNPYDAKAYTTIYPVGDYGEWSFAATDRNFFEMNRPRHVVGNSRVKKRDITTGAELASAEVVTTTRLNFAATLFSPKKIDK